MNFTKMTKITDLYQNFKNINILCFGWAWGALGRSGQGLDQNLKSRGVAGGGRGEPGKNQGMVPGKNQGRTRGGSREEPGEVPGKNRGWFQGRTRGGSREEPGRVPASHDFNNKLPYKKKVARTREEPGEVPGKNRGWFQGRTGGGSREEPGVVPGKNRGVEPGKYQGRLLKAIARMTALTALATSTPCPRTKITNPT